MKKSLLIGLTLSSTLLLTACGNKEKTPTLGETPTPEMQEQPILPSQPEITMTCPEAIQTYLNNANLEGEGDATVQANDLIIVDYIGRLADGTVFDTSIESVATNCGTYTSGRNYNEGLKFTAGVEQMIPGFDAAVLGMKINQTKTVNIPVAEAYGEYRADRVINIPTDGMDISGLSEGVQIMTPDGVPATISKITDKEITLDYNSPLAGKDLIFDITLKSIN